MTIHTASRAGWLALSAGLLIGVCAVSLLAAPAGVIIGTVRDSSGAVIVGAQVTATHAETNRSRTVTTDSSGNFVLPALPLGAYSVEVTQAGFKQAVTTGIVLQVDQQARVDFEMEVGDTSVSIEVVADAALLVTDTSAVGQVVDNQKIIDLPLNGRNFTQLAALTPGAIPAGFAPLTGQPRIQISGGQRTKTEFLLDGISSQEQGLDGIQFLPSVDAVQEFKVQSNAFAAEYGRGTAIVNATIKAGTNDPHGTVFWFVRNDKFDARNFFAKERGKLKRNQFGGALGGPIIRNRLFFFGNYEGTRFRRGAARNPLVPSGEMRQGDFSALSKPVVDPLAGAPFPGNAIPASRVSPVADYLMQFIPLANNTTGTFQWLANVAQWADQGNGRLDYQITPSDLLFLRYSRNVGTNVNPGRLPTSGELALDSRAHNAALSYSRIIGPNLLNEARVGYTHLFTHGVPQGLGVNHTALAGIRGFEETSLEYPGLPRINVTGFGVLIETLSYRPATAPFQTYQFADSLTWTKGKHTLKAGYDYRRFKYTEYNAGTATRGRFNYSGRYSGHAFGDYLLSFPISGQRSFPENFFGVLDTQHHFFAQDDWKVSSRLTINAGLRYELNSVPRSLLAQASVFDAATGKFIVSTLPNGEINLRTQQVASVAFPFFQDRIVTAREAGRPNDLQEPYRRQFAPRFGFAFRPSGGNSTVIRGGFGVFYVLQRSNTVASDQVANPPFHMEEDKTNTTPIPAFTTANLFDAPLARATVGVFTMEPRLRPPYSLQWNLAVQRQLSSTLALEAAYVASKGNRLESRTPFNFAIPGPGDDSARRPYPEFALGALYANNANSNYHSLQLKLEKRLSSGLSFLSSYVWSKLIDNGTLFDTGSAVQDPTNLRLERGLAVLDHTHRLVNSFVYELPVGPGKRFGSTLPPVPSTLISGWQIGGIVQFQSGFPFTPELGTPDPLNVAREYGRRPDRVASGEIDNWTINRYFDTSAFQVPAPFTFGDSGRNILRGPGIANWDLVVLKNTRISDRITYQVRWEMFNAWNTPQFDNPNTNVDPGGPGGRILGAREPRIMQFAMRLSF